MSVKVVVHTVFAAITILQEMEFARQRYDKEEGRVEWGNRIGDRAEIIVDRHENCCKIDIYSGSYGLPINNNKGGKIKMNGKASKPTSPPIPNLNEYDKAWKEAEQAWKDSAFNPEPEEEEEPTEEEKK